MWSNAIESLDFCPWLHVPSQVFVPEPVTCNLNPRLFWEVRRRRKRAVRDSRNEPREHKHNDDDEQHHLIPLNHIPPANMVRLTPSQKNHPPTPPKTNNHHHQQPFIFGVNFIESALVSRSLKSFYGLGPQSCTQLMSKFHIHKTARIGSLGEKQLTSLAGELADMTLESYLKGQMQNNIKRLRDMGTYRGRRHAMGLPVRGQRTRTQVSSFFFLGGLWDGVGMGVFLDKLLTWILADYDGEEVQPHGQDEIGADALRSPDFSFLVFISHALHVARLSWLGARDAYTTL